MGEWEGVRGGEIYEQQLPSSDSRQLSLAYRRHECFYPLFAFFWCSGFSLLTTGHSQHEAKVLHEQP